MERWVKIYEGILDWEWADDPNMVSLWVHLLLRVNYRDKKWHGIEVKRGQLITSLASLNEVTGISVQSIRTCLKRLEETGEITIKSTNKFRIITICKYAVYQGGDITSQQANNKQITSNQQTTNKQLTTTQDNIEEIQGKNIKKITTKVVTKESFVAPEFESVFNLWLEYKKERRESYKSQKSLQACYNKLLKLANGNPIIAGLIVEQSMANNWAGLFPLKTDNNGTDDKQAKLFTDGAKAVAALAAGSGGSDKLPF